MINMHAMISPTEHSISSVLSALNSDKQTGINVQIKTIMPGSRVRLLRLMQAILKAAEKRKMLMENAGNNSAVPKVKISISGKTDF